MTKKGKFNVFCCVVGRRLVLNVFFYVVFGVKMI